MAKYYSIQVCDNFNAEQECEECQYEDIGDKGAWLVMETINADGEDLFYCEGCGECVVADYISDEEKYPRLSSEDGAGYQISWGEKKTPLGKGSHNYKIEFEAVIYLSIEVGDLLQDDLKEDQYRV